MLVDDWAECFSKGDVVTVNDAAGEGFMFTDHEGDNRRYGDHEAELVAGEPIASTPKFKIGDRVIAIGDHPEGLIGTIVHISDKDTILVAFDGWTDGHRGSGAGFDLPNNGWWCEPANLELVPVAPDQPTTPDNDNLATLASILRGFADVLDAHRAA